MPSLGTRGTKNSVGHQEQPHRGARSRRSDKNSSSNHRWIRRLLVASCFVLHYLHSDSSLHEDDGKNSSLSASNSNTVSHHHASTLRLTSSLEKHINNPGKKDDRLRSIHPLPSLSDRTVSIGIDRNLIENRLHQSQQSNEWEFTHRKDTPAGPFPHFFIHIPKTGGYYASFWIIHMLYHTPQMLQLSSKQKFRLCNIGAQQLAYRPKSHTGKDGKPIRCNMWMSEQPYEAKAANSYTLIRDPRKHVLSQYFHCTESTDRPELLKKRLELIGSLDNWLEKWVGAIDDKVKERDANDMRCYDPRNLQSRYVDYDPLKWINNEVALGDLEKRFTVIGPMDEMDKTLCVTFIHYTGWIPPHCDCTAGKQDHINVVKKKPPPSDVVAADINLRRRLRGMSHGVVNHGNSYNTTQYQDELIRKLTEKDVLLYEGVKQLFDKQVQVLEKRMNVTLCNQFNRVD